MDTQFGIDITLFDDIARCMSLHVIISTVFFNFNPKLFFTCQHMFDLSTYGLVDNTLFWIIVMP